MLLLTRRVGEAIVIGDDIRIITMEIRGGQVKYGIQAPKDTPVHREEVFERIKKEKERK